MHWKVLIFSITWVIQGHNLNVQAQEQNETERKSLYASIYAKYEGDIYLAALFSLRHASIKNKCGRIIDQDGLQVIEAAAFALDMVKKEMNLPIRIGFLAIDTCQNPEHGLEQSKGFMLFKSMETELTYVCSDNKPPLIRQEYRSLQRVFGIFGAGNSDVTILAATFLRLVQLPQVSYFSTSPDLSDSHKFPGFFRTIPSDNYTIQAISSLLRRYKLNYIHIVNDASKYSISTKESFTSFVKSTNQGNNTICYTSTTISQENIPEDVKRIHQTTLGTNAPKVIVTFLTQAVIEDLLSYIEKNSIMDFGKLIWVGTDSWGGRKWPNVSKNNMLLNHSISIIPKAYDMPNFMKHYKGRRPSINDYNPWLARAFERECNCQYSNKSLFIYPELLKMRHRKYSMARCETIEDACSVAVFKDSEQMPYIHYVMDGILAYANVVKSLVGANCDGLNNSECADLIWTNGSLNYVAVNAKLKAVKFNDSTNEPFYFWKEKEGVPHYSLMMFNTTSDKWDIVGSLLDYNESLEEFKFNISNYCDKHLKDYHLVGPCSLPCKKGQIRVTTGNQCCWTCETCTDRQITNILTPNKEFCQNCEDGYSPNMEKNACIEYSLTFLTYDDLGALIIFVVDIFGLFFCILSFVCMITYWNTPIIKAFGRETSSIILLGTVLSFVFSISLFGKPTKLLCIIQWFTPAFCTTICYASILTKTNRIVRIFDMNWSSKKRHTPRFISPMSQITIVAFITFVESSILIALIVLKKVDAIVPRSPTHRRLMCNNMAGTDILLAFLIPALLLSFSTVYAFKMRKTPDGFNETRNINFMNFANCVVLVTSLFLYVLLPSSDCVYPLCLQMTLGAYGNLLGLFAPKIYLVLFRKDKNTMESVTARNRSQTSVSQPGSQIQLNGNLANLRCRKCHSILPGSQSDARSGISLNLDIVDDKPSQQLYFSTDDIDDVDDNDQDFRMGRDVGISNPAFNFT